jgi:hypothetical protein
MTGSQMDRLLPAAGIADSSQQSTKWKRVYESLARRQNQDGNGNAVCRFIKVAMAPERFGSEPERFEAHREGLNLTLGFVGLELRENGKLYPAAPTSTLSEAQERANALKTKLRERNVHPDVLAFCRAELWLRPKAIRRRYTAVVRRQVRAARTRAWCRGERSSVLLSRRSDALVLSSPTRTGG